MNPAVGEIEVENFPESVTGRLRSIDLSGLEGGIHPRYSLFTFALLIGVVRNALAQVHKLAFPPMIDDHSEIEHREPSSF